MPRKRLYLIFLALSATGFLWILANKFFYNEIPVCLFRKASGIPCPSCGITGTIWWMFGDYSHFHFFNILGIIVLPLIVVIPAWIILDLISGKQSFFNAYLRMESVLKKKYIAIPLILLVLLNWIWNIYNNLNI